MQPRIKVGLIAGSIGLVLNICMAAVLGICGPMISLTAGALAGFFSARQGKPASKNAGAQDGAIAGALAGALVLLGQVIGGISALAIVQLSGVQLPFGKVPPLSSDISQQAIFYLTGTATAICFGLVGVILSALAGAGTGYLGAANQEM